MIDARTPATSAEPERTARAARIAFLVASVVLVMFAAALPSGWYDALPRNTNLPPRPFDGMMLLRMTFLVQALVFAALAVTGWKPAPERHSLRAAPSSSPQGNDDVSSNHAVAILAFIIAVAIVFRVYRLGSDLWLDEIATVGTYAARPLAEVYAAYLSPGNHLLNSLLLKISVAVFGESEWSVRLPAVAFGVATIPAMYWAARLAMSRAASLGAALLLAVSYHHIFFSQNARGYSGHLFFTLVSSALLASALRRDRLSKWVAYVLSMTLGFAVLMTTAFTLGAHVIVGAIALASRWRDGISLRPLAMRLGIAFAAAGFFAFQVYAVSIPDVIAIYPTIYAVQGSGYVLFSREFATELIRGLSAGFAVGIVVLPFVAVAAGGFIILIRRNWALASSLALVVALTVAFLLIRGQSIAPRLLLSGLPLAILSCLATVDAAALLLARRGVVSRFRARALTFGVAAGLSAASLLALPRYYSAPKQPYRSAIRYVEVQRRSGDDVVVVYPAVGGFRYYLPREGVNDTRAYHFVTDASDYDSALRSLAADKGLLVTTLFRVLHSASPELTQRIDQDWVAVTVFRGTLGGGGMTIWRRRGASRAKAAETERSRDDG